MLLVPLASLLLSSSAFSGEGKRVRLHAKAPEFAEDDVMAEVQFGREVAARVLGKFGLHDKEELTRYVNLVGKSVAAFTGRPELDFRFGVLDTDSINAYAAPGGYVFVTRGALREMQGEAQLAAVLAHEIAHIDQRHIVSELNVRASGDSPVAGFARFMGGAGDPTKMAFLKTVDKAVEILFERGYRAEDEREADRTAAAYLAISGYDPDALASYLERVKEKKGEDMSVLRRTHPPFEERINALRETIAEEGLEGQDYNKGRGRFDGVKKFI